MSSMPTPRVWAAAAAARAFITWCSPSTRKFTCRSTVTDPASRAGRTRANDVPLALETTSVARTSARASRPNHRTRARVLSAIDATRGSSMLRMATSVGSRSVTISVFALRVASMPPNSPACASPTLSTTPMSGRAMRTRRVISPMPLAPISATRNSVSSVTSSIVMGAPTSLLNDARGAMVGPTCSRIDRSRFLVVVLPFDPVMPTIFRCPFERTLAMTSVASAPSATTVSTTTSCGTGRSSSWSTTTSAAPFSTACGAKR